MTEDESTRAVDVGDMYAVLPSIEIAGRGRSTAIRGRRPGAGRRLPIRRGSGRSTATRGPSGLVRETYARDDARAGRGRRAGEDPRDRRRRVHRPLGGRRAAGSWPRGRADRQPRRRRRREPRRVRAAIRASDRSSRATSAMRPRAGAGPPPSTRSPISRRRSRSRTRSTIPATTFENDVVGTFNGCSRRPARSGARFLFMSTCMVYDRATTPRHRRGPPDEAGVAVCGVEAVRRGADALVLPRLRAADDGRPAVQHLRPVPAVGRRGRRRRDLHPALACSASSSASTAMGPRRATSSTSRTAPGSSPTRWCPTRRPAGS